MRPHDKVHRTEHMGLLNEAQGILDRLISARAHNNLMVDGGLKNRMRASWPFRLLSLFGICPKVAVAELATWESDQLRLNGPRGLIPYQNYLVLVECVKAIRACEAETLHRGGFNKVKEDLAEIEADLAVYEKEFM